MKEYDKLKHNIKTFIVEYFSTKGIEADQQVYEGKISEDIYYKQTLIEIDILFGEDYYVDICLNAYPGYEEYASESISMEKFIPIVEDENILSVNVISLFTKMYSRLEKIINFMLEEKWLRQFF